MSKTLKDFNSLEDFLRQAAWSMCYQLIDPYENSKASGCHLAIARVRTVEDKLKPYALAWDIALSWNGYSRALDDDALWTKYCEILTAIGLSWKSRGALVQIPTLDKTWSSTGALNQLITENILGAKPQNWSEKLYTFFEQYLLVDDINLEDGKDREEQASQEES